MQRIVLHLILILSCCVSVSAQINIWEGTPVDKHVVLTPYLSHGTASEAVIVCPGGSYFWHDTKTEGEGVARWLQNNGISAFVLDYRTAGVPAFIFRYRMLFRGHRYPDAQDDLRQAIRYVKSHAEEYDIDKSKIGVIGFSAGGHLAMSSVELFEKDDWPAFIVAAYPVVTMSEPCVHKRSRRGLLGDSKTRNRKLCDSLSLERHVPSDCPPVFLTNCVDDPIVDYHNSLLLDSALTAKGVDHCYVQFQTGGHGFGASEEKGSEECRRWKMMFLEWVRGLKDKKGKRLIIYKKKDGNEEGHEV